ncbi:hut operon transcriptional regulator HutP [Caldalkalibacillus mannanilyticus]|uniref:hut operon transcriptional regulator HutP n=1 Tax=Caldalkalibacillus mannanilyticus TaxID=1418 RepID=UPI00046A8943|nr:hut operon transcriptional regulator HutP [Caldalkalibacillus mannanilyticus]
MIDKVDHRIGRNAILLAIQGQSEGDSPFLEALVSQGCRYCQGKVGSMDAHKVVAAIETAAKKQGVIRTDVYRETHALYHAIMEGLHGITRGQIQLGTVLRTVGLNFSVVRGRPYTNEDEGEWIAVAVYGTIGAPVKGLEHEAIGLGINHI